LLILALAGYVSVAAIENQSFPIYFIYSTPAFACGAFWVYDSWRHPGVTRFLPAALLAASLLATLGGFSFKLNQNDLDRLYRPPSPPSKRSYPQAG
jgi:hypothetical protein